MHTYSFLLYDWTFSSVNKYKHTMTGGWLWDKCDLFCFLAHMWLAVKSTTSNAMKLYSDQSCWRVNVKYKYHQKKHFDQDIYEIDYYFQ